MLRSVLWIIGCLLLISCGEDTLPKPKGYLSLNYGAPSYQELKLQRPYNFKVANAVRVKDQPNQWLKITYPRQRASLDITYRPIKNNLKELLLESEKLVFEHTVKAEQISSKDFIDEDKKVFGTVYEITGNAASHIQFHLTDSTKHFIKGALFFNSRPNYDSVLPAVEYIKKDIDKLIETLYWVD